MPSIPCSGCKNACLSELLGTYLLVFIGPGSVVLASSLLPASSLESLTLIAAVFGLTVGSIIVLLGRHSGAHINPAVTLASALSGALRRELFVPYVFFQLSGGLLAGLSLLLLFRSFESSAALGSTKLAAGVTPLEGVVIEAIGTFTLAISALVASSFVKSPARQAVLVGGTLFVLIMFIGPLTGASLNPARSLGPSLFSGYLSGQIVYLVGPPLGAGCAGLIFGLAKKSHGKGNKKLNTVCLC
jgi:MIP family channel proteins